LDRRGRRGHPHPSVAVGHEAFEGRAAIPGAGASRLEIRSTEVVSYVRRLAGVLQDGQRSTQRQQRPRERARALALMLARDRRRPRRAPRRARPPPRRERAETAPPGPAPPGGWTAREPPKPAHRSTATRWARTDPAGARAGESAPDEGATPSPPVR